MADNSSSRKRIGRWRPRMARSPKNRRRVSPFQVALRVAMMGLAAHGLWMVFHSPRLAVRRVEVIGADRMGQERAKHLAEIPLGRNIFCVNLYRARVRVESDPLV